MTTAVAGMLETRRAPTVGQMLADPVLSAAHYDTYFGMAGQLSRIHYDPTTPVLIESSEIEAFQDLSRFSSEVDASAGPEVGAHDALLNRLHVLGRSELEIAADAMSAELEHRIRRSRRGEVIVGVNPGGSSLLVYNAVLRALGRRGAELPAAVTPFDVTSLSGVGDRRERRRVHDRLREGVELVDDYLITGRQLRNTINSLLNYGVSPESIRSRFVSVADRRHASTIVPGTPEPEGVFSHRAFSQGEPSITTTWSPSDFGFRHIVATLLEKAGSPIGATDPSIKAPLLFTPIREYRLQKGLAGQDLPPELQARIDAMDALRRQPWLDLSSR